MPSLISSTERGQTVVVIVVVVAETYRAFDRSMRVLDICGFKFEKMFLEKLG